MSHIPKTTPEPTTAQAIVDRIIDDLNAEIDNRINVQKRNFPSLWNESVTPDELLAAMGDKAQMLISLASENVNHIERCATILGVTLDDMLPEAFWKPRRAFVPGPNGTLTLAPPAEGYDAWGNLIPVAPPEPEPIPGPITEQPEPVETDPDVV